MNLYHEKNWSLLVEVNVESFQLLWSGEEGVTWNQIDTCNNRSAWVWLKAHRVSWIESGCSRHVCVHTFWVFFVTQLMGVILYVHLVFLINETTSINTTFVLSSDYSLIYQSHWGKKKSTFSRPALQYN